MGANCSTQRTDKSQNIDPRKRKNVCSQPINDPNRKDFKYQPIPLENICDVPAWSGYNDTGKYCLYVGSYNGSGENPEDYEWIPLEGTRSCDYWNGGAPLHEASQSSGCCNGDCVITGGEYTSDCGRVAFNAFPPLCCFNDLACNNNGEQDACFDTPLRERTCDFKYRDTSNPECQNQIEDYCTGDKLFPQGNVDWKDLWKNQKKINLMNLLIDSPYASQYNNLNPPIIKKVNSIYSDSSYISGQYDTGYPVNISFSSYIDSLTSNSNSNIKSFGNYLSNNDGWGPKNFPEVSDVNRDSLEERIQEFAVLKSQPCFNAVLRQSSNIKQCDIKTITDAGFVPGVINQEGYDWSKKTVNKIFTKYFNEIGGFDNFFALDREALGKDSEFEETLYDLCKIAPGLCIESITKMCQNVTSEDLENLSTGDLKKKWCGCYMRGDQYNTTDLGGIVPRQCNQFCNNDQSIPYLDKNLNKLQCLENICSITNDTVNLNRTQGGSIEFGQVCPGCGNSKTTYGYSTENFALDKLVTKVSDIPPIKNVSDGNIAEGNYFVTLLVSSTKTTPNQSTYISNPLCEIKLDNTGKITSFILVSKGSESFSDSLGTNGGPKTLYFNSIFTKNIDPLSSNRVTPIKNIVSLIFSTVKYAKRNVKGKVEHSTKYSGYCQWIDLGKEGRYCDWTPSVTKKTKEDDSNTYHDKSIGKNSVNRCTCRIIGTNLNEVNDSLVNINLLQNCGNIECYNDKGEKIACSNDQEEPKLPTLDQVIQGEIQQELDEKYGKISRLLIGAVVFVCIYLIVSKIYEGFIKRR